VTISSTPRTPAWRKRCLGDLRRHGIELDNRRLQSQTVGGTVVSPADQEEPTVPTPKRATAPQPDIDVEVVTPDKAHEWLGQNQGNRHLSPSVVQRYATDMRNGDWRVTGDPLRFTRDGRLLDGQHRLAAVIAAQVTVPMVVIRNVPDNAQEVIDSGLRRRLSDSLAMRGASDVLQLAATVRFSWWWDQGFGDARRTYTNAQGLAYYERHAVHLVMGNRLASQVSTRPLLFRRSAMAAVMARITASGYGADADDFISKLRSGADLGEGEAILTLRRWSMNAAIGENQANLGSSDWAQQLYAAMAVKAWNAHAVGRPLIQLKWVRSGKSAEDFPALRGPDGEPLSGWEA
jgi:hypothetical protein